MAFALPREYHEPLGDYTIASHLRAMLWARHPDCPYRWVMALAYFTMIWNATSFAAEGLSAYKRFYKRVWNFLDMPLLPWGTKVEAKVHDEAKADDRTEPGFFVGIATDHFRGVLVHVASGAEVVRRSYWTLGDPVSTPVVGSDDLPLTLWTKDSPGL